MQTSRGGPEARPVASPFLGELPGPSEFKPQFGVLYRLTHGVEDIARRIDRVRLGAAASVAATTNGSLYFDAFEPRRQI